MRHHDRSLTKLHKLRKDFFDHRSIHDHLVINACKRLDLKWDRHLRIYECTEPVHNFHAPDFYGADFNDLIFIRTESCCFQIKYHICVIQGLSGRIVHQSLQIIYQISLHSVDHFKIRIGYFRMICLRERLHSSVIGNRYSLVSPGICPRNNILHIGHAVHIAHFCMTMKLHPFLRAVVHTPGSKIRNLFNAGNRTDGQIVIIPVNCCDSFQFHKTSLFQIRNDFFQIFVFTEHLHHDRIGKIRYREHQNRLFVADLPGIKFQNLAFDADFPHFSQDLVDGHALFLKISAVYYVRIV